MEKEKNTSQINYQKTKHQLNFQQEIREERVNILGRYSEEFNNLLIQSDNVLESLLETESGKKNLTRIYELTSNLNIPEKDMETSYLDGLRYNLKAGHRLGFFNTDSDTDTTQLIEKLVSSYTLSFRQTLRSFDKDRDQHQNDSKLVLNIAKRSYLLKPDIYEDFCQQYQSDEFVDKGMIKHFIIGHPKDPKQAIETAKKAYTSLKDQYQSDELVDHETIKNFVVNNPKDPQQAIETAKESYFKLKVQYQGDEFVNNRIIKYFVLNNPKHPKQAIETAKKIYIILKDKYQDDGFVGNYVIKHFVLGNPKDPQQAIEKARGTYFKLKDQYRFDKFADDEIIKYCVITNPTNPQQAIETARETYLKLKEEYKTDKCFDDKLFKRLIVNNAKYPQPAIEKVKKAYPTLKEQYPNISDYKIKFALVSYPNNYKEYLDSFK